MSTLISDADRRDWEVIAEQLAKDGKGLGTIVNALIDKGCPIGSAAGIASKALGI